MADCVGHLDALGRSDSTFEALCKYKEDLGRFIDHRLGYYDIATHHRKLIEIAMEAQKNKALTFKTPVGAAVQVTCGLLYSGANVENLSRSFDDHAEKRAILAALEAGYAKDDLEALALVYGANLNREAGEYAYPMCGFCRQFAWENTHPNLLVIVADSDGAVVFAGPLKILYPLPYPAKVPKRVGSR